MRPRKAVGPNDALVASVDELHVDDETPVRDQAMIEVEGENMRPVTWVRINEFESGDWAIGGKPLRTSDVQALAAGKAA